jgi:hypothetical protein
MLEIPAYAEPAPDAGGVAGLDLNWRVLPSGGILLGMLADSSEDIMIVFDMDRSARSTAEGGMIDTYSEGGFRVVSLGVGPSRWGRNNLSNGVNYGVPDTFAGSRQIRELRDKARHLTGVSWSLDQHLARSFPTLNWFKVLDPVLVTAIARKENVLAVKLDREEREIITFKAMRVSVQPINWRRGRWP